jgi:hypothetical protein
MSAAATRAARRQLPERKLNRCAVRARRARGQWLWKIAGCAVRGARHREQRGRIGARG